MLKRILGAVISAAVFFCFSAVASAESSESESDNFHRSGDWGYTLLSDGTAALSGYYGSETDITVPQTIDGYTLTSLGGGWYESGGETVLYGNIHGLVYGDGGEISDCKVFSPFSGNETVISITLPDTVKYVGSISFSGCTSLTSVTFGSGVEVIGSSCFEECTSLVSADIPDSAYIDQQAFSGCTSLKEVAIGSQSTCDTAAFENCSSLESVEIPSSWETVPYGCFSGCVSLAEVTLSDGITEIGASAFEGCTSLAEIILPESVTVIHNDVFNGCTSLESVEMGESVDTIGSRAFYGCGLKTLKVPDELIRIGENAFGFLSDGTVDPEFELDCGSYTAAEVYAQENGIACKALSAETQLTSMPISERVVSDTKVFTATLVSLSVAAVVIASLIILTVRNRKLPDDEKVGESAESEKSEKTE